MYLVQQTLVVVMMVVFSSMLVMAAGLAVALRASEAGRIWAAGYALVAGAGMALASTIGTGSYTLIALAGWAFLLGRLAIFLGIRVYYGLPERRTLLRVAALLALAVLLYASQQHNAVALLQLCGFGMLGAVSLLTLLSLLNSGVSQRSIGAPLAVLGCLLQLLTQVAGMVHALGVDGSGQSLFFVADSSRALWVALPLVGSLLGCFGCTLLATEQIIARNESGARLDALTGLLNRGALDQAADALIARWQRGGEPLTCLAIDVDYFKQVNDSHGHHVGDAVLRQIAQAIDNSRRASDVAGRYGGEEFCILCPYTDEGQASALANRILRKVRAIDLPGRRGSATVSIGVAQIDGADGSREALWQGLFAAADRALYVAKQRGRDRLVLASSLGMPVREEDGDEDADEDGALQPA